MQLTNFDRQGFLAGYWQKKPLLIRNPWADWVNPLQADELAGLALEPEIESRLILGGDTPAVEHGPLAPDRFDSLGTEDWTLLVQAVDHHIPAVADILSAFRFIPNWRIDDVMVSFAADGGGVGPHFDQYDVFLIQGSGQRKWQIGGVCDEASARKPHGDLQLLAEFEPVEEWVLDPGDMLYVPPGFSHNGVAVGSDCMTYSVGFRAPSRAELLGDFAAHIAAKLPESDRYGDPALAVQSNPGEITPEALDALHAMVIEAVGDREAFTRWFGADATVPKYPQIDWQPETPLSAESLKAGLARGLNLVRNPASRFAFVQSSDAETFLFVDGETYACGADVAEFAQTVAAQDRILAVPEAALDLAQQLINSGALALDQP